MPDQLVIERLEFQGHCGVSEEERLLPQPLAVDLTLDYPPDRLAAAAGTDEISRAIDYAEVADRIIQTGTSQAYRLVETLAERLAVMLFREFPADRVRLWVRKVSPPVKQVQGSVGVRFDRTRDAAVSTLRPSAFLLEHAHQLPVGRVLDVASGYGRNALYLASAGFSVHAVDRDKQALDSLVGEATKFGLTDVSTSCMDLETDQARPPEFQAEAYDALVVFFYLYRPLFPALVRALKPGGVLMYETFLIENHLRYRHPRRTEFCLQPNELLDLTSGLRVVYYEEGEHANTHGDGPAFTARLLARKESRRGAH